MANQPRNSGKSAAKTTSAPARTRKPAAKPVDAQNAVATNGLQTASVASVAPTASVAALMLSGPALRDGKPKEIADAVSKILEMDTEVQMGDNGEAYVVTEEQRHAEERDRRRQEAEAREAAQGNQQMVAQFTAPHVQPMQFAQEGTKGAAQASSQPLIGQSASAVPPEVEQALATLKQFGFGVQADGRKLGNAGRSSLEEKNGVRRPGEGAGNTRKVWEVADAISAKKGSPATMAEMKASGEFPDRGERRFPEATLRTQFQRWRKFNDLVGTGVGDTRGQGGGNRQQAPQQAIPNFEAMDGAEFEAFQTLAEKGHLPDAVAAAVQAETKRRFG